MTTLAANDVATPRPKRTGTLEPLRDATGALYFAGKVRLRDGSRTRVEIPEAKRRDKKAARNYVAWAQEQEDKTGALYAAKLAGRAKREAAKAGAPGETCDAWYARYYAFQREQGLTDADKKRARWRKWISPVIGPKPIASVTRDDVENVRDALDRAIQAWTLAGKSGGKRGREVSGKTAMNVWSALTSSFKAATSSKRRDLRVLDGRSNPCLGVEPPGDRESRKVRRKTFLYPKEAAALLACAEVPRDWREVYAVALYTYLRPGELRVLTWADVDLDAGLVHVTKAWDYADEKVKPPKTSNGVRHVPIGASLAPLLARMKSDAGEDAGDALVVPRLSAFGEDHLAEQFRRHLKVAKVERAELHRSTRTHVQSNFRSCRDSGITWLAMTGLGVDKVMRRAGHDEVGTTMAYVKQAEDLTGELGTPFGALPTELVEGRPSALAVAVVEAREGGGDLAGAVAHVSQGSVLVGDECELTVARLVDDREALAVATAQLERPRVVTGQASPVEGDLAEVFLSDPGERCAARRAHVDDRSARCARIDDDATTDHEESIASTAPSVKAARSGDRSGSPENAAFHGQYGCRRRELNPRPSAYETPALTN